MLPANNGRQPRGQSRQRPQRDQVGMRVRHDGRLRRIHLLLDLVQLIAAHPAAQLGIDVQLETTNVTLVGVLQVRDQCRQVRGVGFSPLDPDRQMSHPAVLRLEATNQASVPDALALEERDHQALLRGYVSRHQLGEPPQRLDAITIGIADPVELLPKLPVTTSKEVLRIHSSQLPTFLACATTQPPTLSILGQGHHRPATDPVWSGS